jgi:hypothetical protein
MERALRYLAIASFFLIAIALCLFNIEALDFGWHLKAGEYIWATKSIPTHDIFTYTADGNRWVDSHWLFQLALYGAHSAAAIPGVVLLRVSVVVATFALLISTVYRREYLPVSILVCLLALFVSHQRFLIRPELVSLLFLAVFLRFLERFPEHPRRSLVVIPTCQAIWANMHGLHVLGAVVVGCYLAGEVLQVLAHRLWPRIADAPTSPRELRQKGLLFALVLLAFLVNANGVDGILYPYKIWGELRGEASYFPNVQELRSPFSVTKPILHPVVFYKAFLVVSILALAAQWRRLRLADLLPYLVFLYLSTLALRNMALFAVVATPVTIHNLHSILDSLRERRVRRFSTQRRVAVATAVSTLALAAGVWAAITSSQLWAQVHQGRSFGIGVSGYFPAELIGYLRTIDGNLFNSPDLGGYLIWQLYPDKKVAMDGRWEVYGADLPGVLRAYRNPTAFAELAKRHDISAVLLGETRPASTMAQWLRKSPAWEQTKSTRHTVLFERRDRRRVPRREGHR